MKNLETNKEENYSIHFTHVERFREVKEIAAYKEDTYYYPDKKNQETCDSFSIQKKHEYLDIYQCTVSKTHDVKTKGLIEIMTHDKNWKYCRVIFVVPDDIYSNFSISEASDTKEPKKKKRKLPVAYNYDKYVLQIPLHIK